MWGLWTVAMASKDHSIDGGQLSDGKLIKKARNAANGRRFSLRFDSEFEESALEREYDTQRQAEVALLANLAFWTDHDREQMWRIFERSALYRSEYESYPEYRRNIINEAIDLIDDTYEPNLNA